MEVDSLWSSPSQIVSDSLTQWLLRKRKRVECQSLRTLNKHWRRQVDQYVVCVRPHASRELLPGDFAALLNFPFLTELDVHRFLAAIDEQDVDVFMFILGGLSSLKKLEVSKVPDWFPLSKLSILKHITKLDLKDKELQEADGKLLEILPLVSLSLTAKVDVLLSIPYRCPRLKYLHAKVHCPVYPSSFVALNAVERVDLVLVGFIEKLDFLEGLNSLVQLCLFSTFLARRGQAEERIFVPEVTPETLELLSRLSNFASLAFAAKDFRHLTSFEFDRRFSHLQSLSIKAHQMMISLPHWKYSWNNLTSLELQNFEIEYPTMFQLFPNLKSLFLRRCRLTSPNVMFQHLANLEQLCLVSCGLVGTEHLLSPISHRCKKLRALSIDCMSRDLKYLTFLPRLEVLGLGVMDYYSYHDRQHLEALTHLRRFAFKASSHEVRRLLDLKLTSELEYLGAACGIISHDANSHSQILYRRTPHLKLNLKGKEDILEPLLPLLSNTSIL